MRRLKALVFIESDVVIRHFLNSGALIPLAERHDVTLVLPPAGYQRLLSPMPQDMWGLVCSRIALPEERRRLWRRLFFIDQMRWRPGSDWANVRRGWQAMIGRKATLQFAAYALPGIRTVMSHLLRRRLDRHPPQELDAILADTAPDIVIHPSTFDGYFINDIIEAAAGRSIPSLLLMNSWDNPSLKHAALSTADAVVVWGEQTARHAVRFMGMARERVHILGAAQFDLFRGPPKTGRTDVCRDQGIAPSQRIVMYAGSSKGNRESLHLKQLSEHFLATGQNDITILYRPHPYGLPREEAYNILNENLPNVVVEHSMRSMLENTAQGKAAGFHITPYDHTHSLLSAMDALISPLSTILVEAAMHGKPVMCFIPWEDDQHSVWRTLRDLVYFREFYECPALVLARSYSEFLSKVDDLLSRIGDEHLAAELQTAMRHFVEFPEKHYGEGLADLAEELCSQSTAR